MESPSNGIFLLWIIMALGLLLVPYRKVTAEEYSRIAFIVFVLTSVATIKFHTPINIDSSTSPEHKVLLSLAQFGILTLSAKTWFALNYYKFSSHVRYLINVVLFSSLFVSIAGAYWLYNNLPALQIFLYPLASLAISLTAELIEDQWANQEST